MGLDTSHGAWHGAYSSFNNWRRAIAKVAGMPPLDSMVGFGGDIKWESLAPSPLHVLLNHSDCDGEISHADCKPLADSLSELLPLIEDATPYGYKYRTEQFIEGCMAAHEAGEDIDFH